MVVVLYSGGCDNIRCNHFPLYQCVGTRYDKERISSMKYELCGARTKGNYPNLCLDILILNPIIIF